jgi:hypothetical protein
MSSSGVETCLFQPKLNTQLYSSRKSRRPQQCIWLKIWREEGSTWKGACLHPGRRAYTRRAALIGQTSPPPSARLCTCVFLVEQDFVLSTLSYLLPSPMPNVTAYGIYVLIAVHFKKIKEGRSSNYVHFQIRPN